MTTSSTPVETLKAIIQSVHTWVIALLPQAAQRFYLEEQTAIHIGMLLLLIIILTLIRMRSYKRKYLRSDADYDEAYSENCTLREELDNAEEKIADITKTKNRLLAQLADKSGMIETAMLKVLHQFHGTDQVPTGDEAEPTLSLPAPTQNAALENAQEGLASLLQHLFAEERSVISGAVSDAITKALTSQKVPGVDFSKLRSEILASCTVPELLTALNSRSQVFGVQYSPVPRGTGEEDILIISQTSGEDFATLADNSLRHKQKKCIIVSSSFREEDAKALSEYPATDLSAALNLQTKQSGRKIVVVDEKFDPADLRKLEDYPAQALIDFSLKSDLSKLLLDRMDFGELLERLNAKANARSATYVAFIPTAITLRDLRETLSKNTDFNAEVIERISSR